MDEREGTPIDEEQTDLCRALWMSVLVQVCVDAKSKNKDTRARQAKAEALAWLAQPTEDSDFATVCELAGIDPKLAKKNIKKFLRDRKGISFRCLRKSRKHKESDWNCQLNLLGGIYGKPRKHTGRNDQSGRSEGRNLEESE